MRCVILFLLSSFNVAESFHTLPKLRRIKLNLLPDQIPDIPLQEIHTLPHLAQVVFQDLSFIVNNVVFPSMFVFSFISLLSGMQGMPRMPQMKPIKLNTFNADKQNVSMNTWVGSPEVFEEVFEVISYLNNEEAYTEMNIELPKGILLEGPPGTGKTLLAKAIASETNSTFISISGSEFVELFVGMGALKVRELFKEARNNKPCILFIDEIDAIGKKRSTGFNSNDEREQTLNQILAEMDGFEDNEGLTILAATNRKDILDEALIRPGRFDRIIRIGLPDKTSREQILSFYLNKKPVDSSVDITALSEMTNGFSGAELKNLVNEAAILAVREKSTRISRMNLDDAFEKLIVGLIRTVETRSKEVLYRVAVHEIGHTFLALLNDKYFDVFKVSIKSTYNGAGGYTLFSEKPEFKNGGLYTKDLLYYRLVIAMGGKAAESVFFGDDFISVGASQDLQQANTLARQMIGTYGMGNELNVFHADDLDYSDTTKSKLDNESLQLIRHAYEEGKRLIEQDKPYVERMIASLLEKNVLFMKDLTDFIDV
jgi:cell division protease FtsH